jgi:F-type H+-transporting ATPase subunit epsilon
MPLQVELVAAEREVWSGEAEVVLARTTDGELGILPGHAPVLGVLSNGVVMIRDSSGQETLAAVLGGFLSVADDRVSILAETAELSHEIDVSGAERDLADATGTRESGEEAAQVRSRAEARLRAAGH